MKNGIFKKYYLALVEGIFEKKEGIIDLPIARKNDSIIERCVDFENGKKSITNYRVIKENVTDNCSSSLLECSLKTGRTHQIRVHMAYIGHPLLGDTLYGNNTCFNNFKNGQELHCYKLVFKPLIENFNVESKCITIMDKNINVL